MLITGVKYAQCALLIVYTLFGLDHMTLDSGVESSVIHNVTMPGSD